MSYVTELKGDLNCPVCASPLLERITHDTAIGFGAAGASNVTERTCSSGNGCELGELAADDAGRWTAADAASAKAAEAEPAPDDSSAEVPDDA